MLLCPSSCGQGAACAPRSPHGEAIFIGHPGSLKVP